MRIHSFRVVPALPERLQGLRDIAYNLLWSWDDDLRVVFSRLDRDLWDSTYQNPVLMLGTIAQERLEALARDESFLSYYDRALERLHAYLREPTWWDRRLQERPLVAYFSAEYGLAECLPIYSGGLGRPLRPPPEERERPRRPPRRRRAALPAGLLPPVPHLRRLAAGELPGQRLLQRARCRPRRAPTAPPVRVEIDLAGRRLLVQVWRVEVGRVPLFLLDTNLPENPPDLQDITDQLYGGDQENRIRQEIVLGIGGLRALRAVGPRPGGLPHERGPLRLPRPRAHPRAREGAGAVLRGGAGGRARRRRLHHPHPGAGRLRRLPARARRPVLRRLAPGGRRRPRASSWPWAGRTARTTRPASTWPPSRCAPPPSPTA